MREPMIERNEALRADARPRRALLLGVLVWPALVLAGCALPGGGKAPRRVRLKAAQEFPPSMPTVAWTLLVNEPAATQSINTARIAFVSEDRDFQYLAQAEWASRAPEMVMELLVESFKNSNRIFKVGDRRSRIRPDFDLELLLNAFQLEKASEEKGEVQVKLEASLVRRPQRTAIASIPFEASATVEPITVDSVLAAFEESLGEVMSQIVEWTLQTGANA